MRLIILLSVSAIVHSKLSTDENQKRVDTCGQGNGPWMWAFTNLNGTRISSATPISSKHFISFANPLFNLNLQWAHNLQTFDGNCGSGIKHVDVPSDALSELRFAPINKFQDLNYKSPKAVSAYFPQFCADTMKNQMEYGYFPIIVEVENELNVDVPCLFDDALSTGDSATYYRLNSLGRSKSYNLKLNAVFPNTVHTTIFEKDSNGDVGGQLLQQFGTTWSLIGINAYYLLSLDEKNGFFFTTTWLLDGACGKMGICEVPVSKGVVEANKAKLPKPGDGKKKEGKKERGGEKSKEEDGNGKKMIRVELVIVFVLAFLWK